MHSVNAPTPKTPAAVISRLNALVAADARRPLYLDDLCAALGMSDSTLRRWCREHLGTAPLRYLRVRRMHLARRALVRADPTTTTVTAIATAMGFGELGRFSVEYRALFSESPSDTLRRVMLVREGKDEQ
jgi:AraC-like DNA-binding protein